MATIASAKTALVAAVGAAGEIVAPPACIVFSNGSDLTALGGTGVEWGYIVRCYVGSRDNEVTGTELATYVQAKLAILQALAGWRVVSVGGDTLRTDAGGDLLSADIIVTTKIDLS